MHEGDDLLHRRERAGDLATVDRLVQLQPVHRHADSTRGDTLGDELGHACDVVVRGGLVGRTALPHHERAYRAVRNLGGDVDRARDAIDRVEVLGDRFPVPPDGFPQRRAGDALDTLHEPDEPVPPIGGRGGEADAAVAHHHGGHAVPDGRGEQRIPRDLSVVVGVDVDESRRDREPGRVELLAPGFGDGADRGDSTGVDRDVGELRTPAEPVDDRPVPDHQIVHDRPP